MTDIKINGNRLFHAYIIAGSDEEGRMAAARHLAKIAVCENRDNAPCGHCHHCMKADRNIHPDITLIEKEKDAKELTVDTVRDVRAAAVVLPNEAEKGVYIINDADTMNIPAQNAMLKILEEPPEYAVFILLASNPDRMLATVRSRCETILLPPKDEFQPSSEAEDVLRSYVRGDNVELLKDIMALEKLQKNELLNALIAIRRGIVSLLRDGKIDPDKGENIISAANNGEKYMTVNVSNGYIVGLLLAAFTA
jgi:DNA polymerase III delta prime subunit